MNPTFAKTKKRSSPPSTQPQCIPYMLFPSNPWHLQPTLHPLPQGMRGAPHAIFAAAF